ncbi:MAG: hypothetical protein HY744_13160 [Deltaproteobacteria bacterium]|nr:hypothetical protein [Deltaproteobacteria bacterium]
MFGCVVCGPGTCGDECAVMCKSCSTGATCADCINAGCATDACKAALQACSDNPECGAFLDCVDGCGGTASCWSECAKSHPNGVTTYRHAIVCVTCTKPACYDDCRAEGYTCAAAGGL